MLTITKTAITALAFFSLFSAKEEPAEPPVQIKAAFPEAHNIEQISVSTELRNPPDVSFRVTGAQQVLGYAAQARVKVKSASFDVLLVTDPGIQIKDVHILNYNGRYGSEIRRQSFLAQFKDQPPTSALRLREDIHAASGATISSRGAVRTVQNLRNALKALTLTE